jgi:hypothetical protein
VRSPVQIRAPRLSSKTPNQTEQARTGPKPKGSTENLVRACSGRFGGSRDASGMQRCGFRDAAGTQGAIGARLPTVGASGERAPSTRSKWGSGRRDSTRCWPSPTHCGSIRRSFRWATAMIRRQSGEADLWRKVMIRETGWQPSYRPTGGLRVIQPRAGRCIWCAAIGSSPGHSVFPYG